MNRNTTLAPALARPRALRLLIAATASSILADTLTWLRPMITDEFVTQRAISNATAGFISTAEMVTMAATMLFCSRYIGAVRFRSIALLGIALSTSGTLASMVARGSIALITVRLVGAIGFGLLALVPATVAARLPDPPSAYGRIFAVSMACNAAMLSLLPWLGGALGHSPAFPAYAILAVLLMPLILLMPADVRYASASRDYGASVQAGLRRRTLVLAGGYVAVAVAYMAVWTFFVALGERASLSPDRTSRLTSLMAIASILGSLGSAPLTRLLGIQRATLVVIALLLLSLELLVFVSQPTAFSTSGLLMALFWFMMFPAVLGWAAQVDPSGRGSAIVSASGWLLGGAGSYIGGVAIDWAGYPALGAVVAVMVLAALILFASAASGENAV